MTSRRHVRFYPADFMAAVAPYSATVAGAYILALCEYWEAGSVGLPDDPPALRQLCRCSEKEWQQVGPVVFGKLLFKDANGLWQEPKRPLALAA